MATTTSPKFVISKLDLVPQEVFVLPLGQILYAGFDGDAAFIWVKHDIAEQNIMQAVALPSGGPFELETNDELFYPPAHATSFMKTIKRKITGPGIPQNHTSCWHVFQWYPKPVMAPVTDDNGTVQ